MRPVRTAARALLGAIFVAGGARAVASPDSLVPQAKRVTDRVGPLLAKTDPRLPSDTRTLVQVNGAAQLVGGLLLATGHLTRPAAALLAGTLVPQTIAAHPFWTFKDGEERRSQQAHFLKNLGLLGGLLLAAVDTQGRPSLAWRTGRLVDDTQRSVSRGLRNTQRGFRTAQREARIAVKAARAGRRLPG